MENLSRNTVDVTNPLETEFRQSPHYSASHAAACRISAIISNLALFGVDGRMDRPYKVAVTRNPGNLKTAPRCERGAKEKFLHATDYSADESATSSSSHLHREATPHDRAFQQRPEMSASHCRKYGKNVSHPFPVWN